MKYKNKTKQLLFINRICDEFEAKLKAGSPTDIKQLLGIAKSESGSQHVVDELFIELVTLKIIYSNDPDSAAMTLKSQYPDQKSIIDNVKNQQSLNSTSRGLSRHTKVIDRKSVSLPAPKITRLGSRFESLDYLASGGLGDVYTGYDKSVKRVVAIKLLKAKLVTDENARRRFLDEAAITGRLEHPGIVPIHDSGVSEDGRPYYVMRLFRGRTMKEHIKELHSLTNESDFAEKQRSLVRSLTDIGKAVSYAHDHQIIHRDLKPTNIMLGDYGEAIVIDWGLARVVSASQISDLVVDEEPTCPGVAPSASESLLTKAGAILGTPGYMSPEQAAGNSASADVPADIYSLGAVLYTIITGDAPEKNFGSDQHGSSNVLLSICARSMNQNPGERYPDMRSFGADLEGWLNDLPVVAKPDTALDKASRFFRKNRNWSLLATVTLLTMTIGSLTFASLLNARSIELAKLQQQAMADAEIQKELAEQNVEIAERERETGQRSRVRLGVLDSYFRLSIQETGDFSKASIRELVLDRLANFKESKSLAPDKLMEYVETAVFSLKIITDYEQALSTYQEFSDLREDQFDGDLSKHVYGIVEEAGLMVLAGKRKEALPLLELWKHDAIEDLGLSHEATQGLLRQLVSCLDGHENREARMETIELLYPWLPYFENDGVPDVISVEDLRYAGLYAHSLRISGKVAEASLLWSKLDEKASAHLGATEVHVIEAVQYHAEGMWKAGNVDLALKAHRLLAERLEDEFGADSPRTLLIQIRLAELFLQDGWPDEVLELVRLVDKNANGKQLYDNERMKLNVIRAKALLLKEERGEAVVVLDRILKPDLDSMDAKKIMRMRKLVEGEVETEAEQLLTLLNEIEWENESPESRWDPYLPLTVPY